jgi:hypothetical protein
MSNPISVDMRSVTVSGASAGNPKSSGQSLDARIAALKQKLVDLFDDLKRVSQERTPESVEKAKMIQMQIQVTQAQIMQLEAMKQQKIQDEQRAQQQAGSASKQAAINAESLIGQNINNFI